MRTRRKPVLLASLQLIADRWRAIKPVMAKYNVITSIIVCFTAIKCCRHVNIREERTSKARVPLWCETAGVPLHPWSNKSAGNLQSCFMLQKLPSLTNLISVDRDERVNFTAEESLCDFPSVAQQNGLDGGCVWAGLFCCRVC